MTIHAQSQGAIEIVNLRGRFDAHMAPQLKDWQDSTTDRNHVVVNLAGVTFIDSSALAMLVRGLKRCRQQGGDVHLCAMQPPVRIIFELTKLDKAFRIFPTEQDAVAAFR